MTQRTFKQISNMNILVTTIFFGIALQTVFADRPPVLTKYMDGYDLLEDTEPGTIVYTLEGYDPENRPITFGVSGDVFYVYPNSGKVELKRRLDYERNQILRVVFTIGDRVNKVSKIATINLKDVNDVKPVFTKSTYFREINESFPLGGVVIPTIQVTDPDGVNDFLDVRCNPGTSYVEDCATFRVERTKTQSSQEWQGQIVLNKILNYEQKRNYQVPLVAFDGVNNQTKSVEIRVVDVPDLPPYFVRAISVSVNEETPVGTILTQVSAADGDTFTPRPLKYSIYNDTTQLFRINEDSGDISINKRLDRESQLLALGFADVFLKVREVISQSPLVLGDSVSTTATTTIRVNILDINDNKPTFTENYSATIPENIANDVGIPNLLMTVIDRDTGTNANYIFTIETYADRFYIQPDFGEGISTSTIRIKNTSLIDYEKGPKIYKFQVIARENKTTELFSGTTTVTIYVTDVNDNVPIPQKPLYTEWINEIAPPGSQVAIIKAVDDDSGDFGTAGIRYVRLKGMYSNLFSIDQKTGNVTVAPCATPGKYPCLDSEFRQQINVTVEIADNNNDFTNVQRAFVDLIINVVDTNDNVPIFPNTIYYGKISEGNTEPAPELFVKAEDNDLTAGTVRYSIVNSEVPGLFQINVNTGKITAKTPVQMSDTGTDKYINMEVIANDGKYQAKAKVRIEVLDKNNNKPTFPQANYKICIPEDFSGGKSVIKTSAVDNDKPNTRNSQISYVIETGAEGQFTIDQNGLIQSSFQASFDYEKKNLYTFLVVARDNGSPQLSSDAVVQICITDINDVLPLFVPFTTQINVKEDVPVGYSATTLNGVDPDLNAKLIYRFVDPSSAINPNGETVLRSQFDYTSMFTLDQNTGEVRVANTLQRDKASIITQTVNVIDVNGITGQTGTGTIIINIQDVNQIPPVFASPWTKANPYYNVTINEEQTIGSFVTILNVIDEDGAVEGYRIFDPDGYFAITNGVVTVKKRIDYEKVEKLKFVAYAWDNVEPKMTATATVFVDIVNINDNAPQFLGTYNPVINENSPTGTTVVTVTATDADKGDYGEIRYKIADQQSAFMINSLTGLIIVRNSSVLDRERVPQIVLPVTAYDSPKDISVRLNTTIPVYIELRDENDNSPVFEQRSYYETVIESIPPGSRILDISARDIDIGKNAIIIYQEGPGDTENLFSVNPNGAVNVRSSLMNKIGNHTFQVRASNPPFEDLATVTINVMKGASLPPVWTIPATDNLMIPVLESQYRGMYIYQVKAQDPDNGPGGLITYSFLVEQQPTQKTVDFLINPVTGVIRAQRVYDREKKDLYNLIILATDHSKNPQSTARRLRIQILDVNDNKPQFPTLNGKLVPYSFEVPEDAAAGYHIGDIMASDIDLKPTIYYYILSGNEDGVFELGKSTGTIKLKKPIDREDVSSYRLSIRAVNNVTDYVVLRPRNKRNIDASVTTVNINVADKNDEKPQFTQKMYYGCISTEDNLMKSILKVHAVDKDALGSSVISYQIQKIYKDNILTGVQETFVLGKDDGILRNTEVMSKYEESYFSLDVIAKDMYTTAMNQSRVKWSDDANIQVFVTQKKQAVKITLTQPSNDVYYFIDQIKQLISSKTGDSYICVADIKDHMLEDGAMSPYWSDLFVYIINKDSKNVFLAADAAALLNSAKTSDEPQFSGLYVTSIKVAESSEVNKEHYSLLIIMILVILFVILTLLLTCIACWCIARSKRKRIERASFEKTLMEESQKNPVYSNRAFVDDDTIFVAEDHPSVVYSNRTEAIQQQVEMVDSPLYSTVEKSHFAIPDPEAHLGQEPVMEVPLDDPDFDDPAIYSVPEHPPVELSVPEENPDPEPVIVSSLMDPDPVPVIETEPIGDPYNGELDAINSSSELPPPPPPLESPSAPTSHHSSAIMQSSTGAISNRSSPGLPSAHSSSSLHVSFQNGGDNGEPEPVIVTSPAESPTEALKHMDAVFAGESDLPSPLPTNQYG